MRSQVSPLHLTLCSCCVPKAGVQSSGAKQRCKVNACQKHCCCCCISWQMLVAVYAMLWGMQQESSIIVRSSCNRADNGAALLLQVQDCWWSLEGHPGSKHIVSTPHHARPSPSWAIPTMHSLSTVQIFELPGTASWRP